MAILAQCPVCRVKQKISNKRCRCGEDMDKAKKGKRVRYRVTYYLPGHKLKWESTGFSLEDARNIESDRRLLKKSGRLPEVMRGAKLTFQGLSEWYLGQESVKALASFPIVKIKLSILHPRAYVRNDSGDPEDSEGGITERTPW
jgi:hypothetical protein